MAPVSDWTFDGTWPYEPKWFDSPDGRMRASTRCWSHSTCANMVIGELRAASPELV